MDERIIKLQKENEELKKNIAYYQSYDSLTGIYNKDAFCLHCEEILHAYPNKEFEVICFDLEHFKLVNDYFGTEQGDELLKFIAKQLQTSFTKKEQCVARFVADVFMIFVSKNEGEAYAAQKIQEICGAIKLDMDIIPAIGIYQVKEDIPVSRMCDRATMAAASIKGNYMKHVAYYDESMRNILIEEQELLNGVEDALNNHEFEVYLQPKCNMCSDKIIGAEALVRWVHPQKGIIQPKDFIPIFEKNGFIKKLDQYVWKETAKWIRKWVDNGNRPLPISVNISRIDIIGMDVVTYFKDIIKEYNLEPSWLELEVTESAYSARSDEIIFVIDRLMKNGFTVLMDDFGSGYSSLNMLKDINIDVLKLDMRFLDKSDYKSKNILESVVHMAKWLDLKVVAEGVENRQQVDFLLGIGCVYAQGYYYYRPMPLLEFEALITIDGKADFTDIGMEDKDNSDVIYIKDLLHEDSMSEMLLDNILGAIAIYSYENQEMHTIKANEKYYQMMGDFNHTRKDIIQMVHDDDRNQFIETVKSAKTNGVEGSRITFRRKHQDKGIIWLQLRLFFLSETNGRYVYYASLSDATKDMQILETLKMSQESLHIAMDASRDTIFELDIETKVVKFGLRTREEFGLTDTIVTNAPEGFIEQGSICEGFEDTFREVYYAIYRGETSASCVIKAHMGNDMDVWNRITLIAVKNASGKSTKAIGLVENFTREIELEEKLKNKRL